MPVKIAKDRRGLGKYAGELAATCIRDSLKSQARVRMVVATGSSQFEVLSTLVEAEGIDWSRVDGFHLDEYIGLNRSHPASFCGYLYDRLVKKIPLGSFHFLSGDLPANEVIAQASRALGEAPIDVGLIGIGENGHLAFNDPPADFKTTEPYLVVNLDEACRRQQVGEGWFDHVDQVPTQAISMSVHAIMNIRRLICSVPDKRKAQAVRQSMEGPVTPDVPASILQRHDNAVIVLDSESSALLSAELIHAAENV